MQGPSRLAVWALSSGDLPFAVQFACPCSTAATCWTTSMPRTPKVAQHMCFESGDWITMKLDGIRYLEKPPLPYWLDAICYRIFGQNVFATHLPNALAIPRPRVDGVAVDFCAYGGRRAGLLCRPRRPHLHWAVSLYPLRHPRSAAQFSAPLRSLGLHHWPQEPALRRDIYGHVGSPWRSPRSPRA